MLTALKVRHSLRISRPRLHILKQTSPRHLQSHNTSPHHFPNQDHTSSISKEDNTLPPKPDSSFLKLILFATAASMGCQLYRIKIEKERDELAALAANRQGRLWKESLGRKREVLEG